MACSDTTINCRITSSGCTDLLGCDSGICADFALKRHDTKPDFKLNLSDCDGPVDLTGLIAEGSMWANAKLKSSITTEDTIISFADGVGFNQVMINDVLILDRIRMPEKLLVVDFDEIGKTITVQRGHDSTNVQIWNKGTKIKIIKFTNITSSTEMIYQDVEQMDGSKVNTLMESFIIYEWGQYDTCLPGCYWLEFKLMKPSDVITPITSSDQVESYGCGLPDGIEWIRRFPSTSEGFKIQIFDTPTGE